VSCRPVPMHPWLVWCHSGPSDGEGWKSSTSGESMSRKSSGRQYGSHWVVSMEVVGSSVWKSSGRQYGSRWVISMEVVGSSVWKSSALGVIPGHGTEVRRGNTYEQGESRRGEGR
jgi:hypothetical protein